MYDGIDYKRKGSVTHKGKSSSGSRLEPYQKAGFWHNPKNQFWNNGSYTNEGRQYLDDFVKMTKPECKIGDIIPNLNKIK